MSYTNAGADWYSIITSTRTREWYRLYFGGCMLERSALMPVLKPLDPILHDFLHDLAIVNWQHKTGLMRIHMELQIMDL